MRGVLWLPGPGLVCGFRPARSKPLTPGPQSRTRPSPARGNTRYDRRDAAHSGKRPGREAGEMSGYLKQKLFQALHDLVGAGDLDQRLTHASNYLAHLQEHEVPEEHRKELGEIKAIMFATPLSSERGYTPRQISTEDGTKLAHRILELYTRVMGGL